MAATNPGAILKYKIDKNFAGNFDELVNIDVSNRKSDVGFTEDEKLMLRMRPGTTQVGNTIAGGSGSGKLFFHTAFNGTRRAYRGYNNKLWYLNGSTWTDTGATFSANDLNFNSVRLPIMLNGTTPTTYTTPANGGGAEKVAISASDPAYGVANSNVGKVLIVLTDPSASNAYRGVFGKIIDNNGTYYTLLGSGISNIYTGVSASATYKVYDAIGEYLQVIDGVSNDKYFDGVTEHSAFAGLATASLRLVGAITSSQYVTKQVLFNNSVWSFNKRSMFFSSGELYNPFFHTFEGVRTIPVAGDIVDVFKFKGRLIVGGSNFLYVYNSNGTFDPISSSFGIKAGSLVDLGDDMYYLATDGEIKSLSETITNKIISTNIGKTVYNHTKNFLTKISSGFDGRKMYLYGQIDANTAGVVVVFDLSYKFWSWHTGLRPSSIVSENGLTYVTDNNSDKVRYYDSTTFTDCGTAIEQKVSIKEVDLGDAFSIKILKDSIVWLDNFDQELYHDTYMALASKNTRKLRKILKTNAVNVSLPAAPSIGSGLVGGNVLGGSSYTSSISYPFIFRIPHSVDKANLWKVILTGKDGSPFYLNELDLELSWSGDKRSYFSPNHAF